MLEKITIIYNTCDKYESLWPGFFCLWDRFWPNCKNDIILNTETKDYQYLNLNIKRSSNIERERSWSQRLLDSLEVVNTPYVLLVLDDFYIKSPIRLDKIENCIKQMEYDTEIGLFTFAWEPGPNSKSKFDSDFELRGRFAKYRINAQIGLWKVEYLKKILKGYENPWQFELNGSFRSSLCREKIYSLKKGAPLVFDYDWGFLIIRGKLNMKIADYFVKNENISMDLPFEPFVEDEYNPPEGLKIVRMIRYAKDMLMSLFKK